MEVLEEVGRESKEAKRQSDEEIFMYRKRQVRPTGWNYEQMIRTRNRISTIAKRELHKRH